MKLYIVDDSRAVRHRLKCLVSDIGGEILGEADNEESAVSGILNGRPDVVILDLALAAGSGVGVLRRIKQEMPTVFVIILSNHSGEAYQNRCKELGANLFLSKNREFDLLADLLNPPMFHI